MLGKARAGARTLGLRLVQDSRSMLQLTNTSRIISLPGTPRSVRGWSARLLIIDEAAFVGADTFTAARALVATGGRTILQSTPGNEAGDFYEAVRADDERVRFTIPSESVSTIAPTFLESERRSMTPEEFGREYECRFGTVSIVPRLFSRERLDALFPEEVA